MKKTSLSGYPHIDKPWMKFYDEEVLQEEDPKVNMTEYLKEKTKGLDNHTVTSYYGRSQSYAEFWEKVNNASKVLTELGISKNETIMNLVPNIPESGELWLGATQIGAISDFIDPRPDTMDLESNAKKVLELIRYERVNHLVALDQCYLAMLRPIEKELKDLGIDRIIILSASDSMNLRGKIDYLIDTINYNKLKNEREKQEAIEKLKWYQAVLRKTQQMKSSGLLYEEAVKKSPLEIIRYSDLLRNIRYSTYRSVYEPNLINYIGHTSGTSGARPKPICLTNENQISSTEQLFRAKANFQIGDRILHILPFFSPLGADNNYVLNIASGSINIDVPEFEINEFGYLLKKYHPNVILGTPSWLAALTKSEYLDKEDMTCITRIISGGDSMTREEEESLNYWLKKHGSSAIVEKGYGMSELCGCGSYAQKHYNRYESIGIPLPNTKFALVDPNNDKELVPVKFEQGEEFIEGEIAISSPAVTLGKLNDEVIVERFKLQGSTDSDEYIRTRDLAKMDREGIFYFDSRKDRSFTRFDGYKIKPYEIEREIENSDLVKHCRIVPYFDEKKKGLMPKAHIVLEEAYQTADQRDITEEIIRSQIIQNPNMSSRQIPAKVKYREFLPLTANSKVNYNALINEGYDGTEIEINVEETNLAVGKIEIIDPNEKAKVKRK